MTIAFNRIKTQLDFLDTLGFGNKYLGKTISYILEFDPEYLEWCVKENHIYLTSKCLEALEDRVGIAKYNKTFQAAKKQSKFLNESWHDDWLDDVPF